MDYASAYIRNSRGDETPALAESGRTVAHLHHAGRAARIQAGADEAAAMAFLDAEVPAGDAANLTQLEASSD